MYVARHRLDMCIICDECCCEECGGGQVEIDTVTGEDTYVSFTCWRCLEGRELSFWDDINESAYIIEGKAAGGPKDIVESTSGFMFNLEPGKCTYRFVVSDILTWEQTDAIISIRR